MGGYDDFEGGHIFSAVAFRGGGALENFPESNTRYKGGGDHQKVSVCTSLH